MPDNKREEELKALFLQMQEKAFASFSEQEIQEIKKQQEQRAQSNLSQLHETLEICNNGWYSRENQMIFLSGTTAELTSAEVFFRRISVRSILRSPESTGAGFDV